MDKPHYMSLVTRRDPAKPWSLLGTPLLVTPVAAAGGVKMPPLSAGLGGKTVGRLPSSL